MAEAAQDVGEVIIDFVAFFVERQGGWGGGGGERGRTLSEEK